MGLHEEQKKGVVAENLTRKCRVGWKRTSVKKTKEDSRQGEKKLMEPTRPTREKRQGGGARTAGTNPHVLKQ